MIILRETELQILFPFNSFPHTRVYTYYVHWYLHRSFKQINTTYITYLVFIRCCIRLPSLRKIIIIIINAHTFCSVTRKSTEFVVINSSAFVRLQKAPDRVTFLSFPPPLPPCLLVLLFEVFKIKYHTLLLCSLYSVVINDTCVCVM